MENDYDFLSNSAIADFNLASMAYEYKSDDEFMLNKVGFHLQQSAEMALKWYISEHGERFVPTHSIARLLAKAQEVGLHTSEAFELFSGTLTTWETSSRYTKGFFLESKELIRGFKLVKELLEEVGLIYDNDKVQTTNEFE